MVPRTAVIVVAAVCVVISALWLRRSWPSRAMSSVFVVIAGLGIATCCLAQTFPGAGLLGSTAFAALGGYIAFFHPRAIWR